MAHKYVQQFLPNQGNINSFHVKTNDVMKRLIKQYQGEFFETRHAPSISKREVSNIIKKLQNKNPPGIDAIPNLALKHLPCNYVAELTRIYNSCFRNIYFPSSWKSAVIKPIPKAGNDPSDPGNYRPISLLPCLGKILERLFDRHLQSFYETNHVILNEQFGFRPGHLTTQQLVRVTENIHQGFEVGGKTAILLLDIEKAFDRLWVRRLMLKCVSLNMP
ncbi:reverse transcriptase family protein, partial [Salmonella enterica subsp. enterica serovar Derby]|nr:reverse transcriptase family protein [Salmonella enterica subsp. enterica serovar Derby]